MANVAGHPPAAPVNRPDPSEPERPPSTVRIDAVLTVAAIVLLAFATFMTFAATDRVLLRMGIAAVLVPIAVIPAAMAPALHRMLPRTVSRAFTPRLLREHDTQHGPDATPADVRALAALGKYEVGMRRVRGDGRADRQRPHATLFYPTDASENGDDEEKDRHSFLPRGDFRYARGTMRYQGTPVVAAAVNLPHCRIHARLDAPAAASLKLRSVAECAIGSAEHPLVVFSHGMAGHQHQYFTLISDLVANGAVVLALEHTDGSAAFSLKPPAHCTRHGEGTPVALTIASDRPPGMTEALFRFDQLYKTRVPETIAAVDFLRTGGAHATLLDEDRELALRHMMAVTAPGVSPLRVALMGHSFGGATAAAAALSIAEHECQAHMSAVVAFDLWHVPTQGLPLIARAIRSRLPPALFIDSEEWARDDAARRRVAEVALAWGPVARRVWTQGTDHLTATEAAYQFKAPFVRKPYKYRDDRTQVTLWVQQALGHIRASIKESKPTPA